MVSSVRSRKPKRSPIVDTPVESKERVFLVVHTGGLGDVVLSAPLFAAIKTKYPSARTVLLVKSAFAGITQLFSHPPNDVIALPIDPSQEVVPTEALRKKLFDLIESLKQLNPDTIIAADLEPTWLSWFLGAALAPIQAVACARISPPRGLLPILISEMGFAAADFKGPLPFLIAQNLK